MPIEKKVCAYCGKNRFGLVRHFVGFLTTYALGSARSGSWSAEPAR